MSVYDGGQVIHFLSQYGGWLLAGLVVGYAIQRLIALQEDK